MGLQQVTLVVDDYDRAITFFTQVFGFDLVEDFPATSTAGTAKRWVVVRARDGGASLLLARADGERQEAAVGNQTGGRVAFFLEVEDVDAVVARVEAAGCELVRAASTETYGRVAVVADPWGNRWDVIDRGRAA